MSGALWRRIKRTTARVTAAKAIEAEVILHPSPGAAGREVATYRSGRANCIGEVLALEIILARIL
jgi:hypothetical protein